MNVAKRIKLSVKTIREAVASLRGKSVLPNKDGNFLAYMQEPKLRDGIVWIGAGALHPATFLDIFGADKFREIKRDVSKARLEKFIKSWERKNASNS
jgi:hypothetical protein